MAASRRVQWAAVVVLTLTCVLVAVTVPLSLGREEVFDTLLYGFLSLSLAAAGSLIIRQHPRNPVGWLFCVLAVYGASAELAEGWGLLAAERGLPGRAAGEWVITWSWIGDLALWTTVLVVFPNGMPSGRWSRATVWMAVLGAAVSLPGQALSTRSDALFSDGRNPFAIEAASLPLLFWAGMALLLTALLAAVVGFVVRMRRARGQERQQLTWFAYAAVMVGATMPVAVVFWDRSVLVQAAVALSLAALPCAAVIAILRYRLYSIDRIINRTVVYGLLSAALGLTYAVVILLMGRLLGGERSSLAVAAATLAAAGLVQPARRRIQLAVDRRFNRRRYDAAATIRSFGARLRDEIDLDTLAADLLVVIETTMQPTTVSSWLRPPNATRVLARHGPDSAGALRASEPVA